MFRRLASCRPANSTPTKLLFTACSLMLASAIFILYMNKIKLQKSNPTTHPVVTIDVSQNGERDTNMPFYGREIETRFPKVRELSLRKGFERFPNEEARVVARPHSTNKKLVELLSLNSVAKLIYLATPYFGEWNPKHFYFPHSGRKTFRRYDCPVSNCLATVNKSRIADADALLFHVRDVQVYKIPKTRRPNQIWILYSMEPPWLEITDMKRFGGVFNWTMSYRKSSDVVAKYGFIGRKPEETILQTEETKTLNMSSKENVAVWYVSNCCTDSRREAYVKRLRKSYPVDVFGGCSVETCRPAESKRCYSTAFFGRYKFYMSFENALCRDYVTEKLYNALDADIIPVVFGGADYAAIAPQHSVIDALLFSTPEELAVYLWQVSNNDTLYRSYFSWKEVYKAYLQPWMCDLCETLHGGALLGRGAKSGADLEEWWTEGRSCQRWTEDGLEAVDAHPFPCYRQKIF